MPNKLIRRYGVGDSVATGGTLMLVSSAAQAVAGGGGGGGSSSGGGDFGDLIFQLIFWIIFDLPFPFNVIVIAVIAGAIWLGNKNARASSGLNRIPSLAAAPKNFVLPDEFLKRNPGFDPALLLAKANTAFLAIQQAWTAQNMAPVRRWISDGVWQRFNTQFAMMHLLAQTNVVANVQIKKAFIDAIEEDGAFDIVHIGIQFAAEDDFVSAKFPQLDRRGTVEMLEYWSFLRKAGAAEHDLYHTNNCPSCGAALPQDMGEIARCASCGAVSTLGEYDWVLSEITQADDYVNQDAKLAKSGKLTERIRTAFGGDGDFSVQLIEDKAANAYMQILAAQVTAHPENMRRFVADALFERLSQDLGQQAAFVFNRLYLNSVTLIDYYREDERDNMVVAVKRTAQRVDIADGTLHLLDQGLYTRNEIVVLSRDTSAGVAKGSLYAHACPACGGPVNDTLDIKCGYCGAVLNSTRHEWIVMQLMATEEYQAHADEHRSALTTGVAPDKLDPLFVARDYVLNNALMMIGIDGVITAEETAFAEAIASKMGYQPAKLAGLFDLAKNRKLALRLPEDRSTAVKVLKLMEKAALADGNISPPEQALLDEVRQRAEQMAA
jgi:uncharacterized Zn finger protein (UPF0148 family)